MRPLPRLLAITTDQLVDSEDFPIRVAAALSVGAGVGIVVRAPGRAPEVYRQLLQRVAALARPTEGAVLAHGDPSLGALPGVAGAVLLPSAWPALLPVAGWYGAEVGPGQQPPPNAAFLVASHSSGDQPRPSPIADWQHRLLAGSRPVFLGGLVLPDECDAARHAGAYGLAVTAAVFNASDPARAAADVLSRWLVA